MSFRFKCTCCGQWQNRVPDLGFHKPFYVATMSDQERTARVRMDSDTCAIDEQQVFVRCVLPINIRGSDETFAYGVWSSLSEKSFRTYMDACTVGREDETGPFFGWLSNRMGGYPVTLSLKVHVIPLAQGLRPRLELHDADHPLVVEQQEGITVERLTQIVGPYLSH